MRLAALTVSVLLAISSIANASLGSFSGSNGTDSVSVTFPASGVLDQLPFFTQTSPTPSANFGIFWTAGSGNSNAIPGFTVNATTSAGSVDFNRAVFNYLPSFGRLEVIDNSSPNKQKIVISGVTGPPVSTGMTLSEVMLTANSTAKIIDLVSGNTISGNDIPVAVPEPSAFLIGGLVLGMVGSYRFARKRLGCKADK